jgi:hypothetical protein
MAVLGVWITGQLEERPLLALGEHWQQFVEQAYDALGLALFLAEHDMLHATRRQARLA